MQRSTVRGMSDDLARQRPSKITDADLLAAASTAANMRQLLLRLGVSAYGGNYETVRRRLVRLGVTDARLLGRARPPRAPDPPIALLEEAVQAARTYADVARAVGWPAGGGPHRRLQALIAAAGLDTSHFVAHWRTGAVEPLRPARPLSEVLVLGSHAQTSNLRERLVREGVLPRRCACCGLETWQGRPIPLELDHVNGIRSDNRLENLRLLCPNCHAQTDTYRGRNIGAALVAAAVVQPT